MRGPGGKRCREQDIYLNNITKPYASVNAASVANQKGELRASSSSNNEYFPTNVNNSCQRSTRPQERRNTNGRKLESILCHSNVSVLVKFVGKR